MFVLYIHTNRYNGKRYVGCTEGHKDASDIMMDRWGGHCADSRRDSKLLFHKAIRKYGENAWDHQKRLLEAITQIYSTHKDGTIVIVAHAGTNKVLLGSFQNTDPDDFYKVPQDNACINIIKFNGNSYKVISINDTNHLKDEKN